MTSLDLYDGFGKKRSGPADVVGFGGRAGYHRDVETGLILCTHRFYNPQQGRFLTRDPIGYAGGINLHGYVGNNPVGRKDPSGYISPLDTPEAIDLQLTMLKEGEGDLIGLSEEQIKEAIANALSKRGLVSAVGRNGERHIITRVLERCGPKPIRALTQVFRNGTGFFDNSSGQYKLYLASQHLAIAFNESGEAVTIYQPTSSAVKLWTAVGRDFLPKQFQ